MVHDSTGASKELIKLFTLFLLGQYLLCFPLNVIEELRNLEGDKEKVREYERLLDQFKIFELLKLDDLIKELYESISPLYSDKVYNNSPGMKLQEVIIKAGKQHVLSYSLCHVFIIIES